MKRSAALLALTFVFAGCSGGSGETTTTTTGGTTTTSGDTAGTTGNTSGGTTGVATTGSGTTTTSGDGSKPSGTANFVGENSKLGDEKPLDGEEVGVIDTKEGQIVVRFFRDKAPGHVENFKKLAGQGFYNGTKFHRIDPNFMIQGGDPNSKDNDPSDDGMGGPGYTIKAEFNDITHGRGVLSMARSQDPDSAGSQFFIVCKPSYFLDTQYTAFGRVVHVGTEKPGEEAAGLKVVDKIATGPRNGDKATSPVAMNITIKRWPIK